MPLFIRKSGLRLPHRLGTPVVMIGPGTGFAPFRGFIQDRDSARAEGKEIGPMILFFGCRNRDHDYIYKAEIEAWKAAGTLTAVHEAFSREAGREKVYVQHLLKDNQATIWALLQDGGHVYVCGFPLPFLPLPSCHCNVLHCRDARNMAKDVHTTFVEMAEEEGGLSPEEARAYVKRMESQKRYQADVWS